MCAFHTANAKTAIAITADPQVLAIPIQHSTEPFVNLAQQQIIAYGPSPEIPNNTDYVFIRQSVYNKLVRAQKQLPPGLHLCLYEGYRSLALQKQLFDTHYQRIKHAHPDWSSHLVYLETNILIAPTINEDGTLNVPPHSTGGAVDVYLIDDNGNAVDMGIHPKDWADDIGGALSLSASSHLSETAKRNRQIMSRVLSAEGFANYPMEYWHWSYGDRYWAFMKQKPFALYGNNITPHKNIS